MQNVLLREVLKEVAPRQMPHWHRWRVRLTQVQKMARWTRPENGPPLPSLQHGHHS